MDQMLIIGGSDAGISAALRIKELDRTAKVTVMAADAFPNFSICGLPFYISGEIKEWCTLAHRTAEDIKNHGIDLLLNHRALSVDPNAKQVQVLTSQGDIRDIHYDKLMIGTGAQSAKPPIKGLDTPGVFFLRWMEESFAVKNFIEKRSPKHAVIIGGGYIGLEMADAFIRLGLQVTLLEFAPEVLTTLDPSLAKFIHAELTDRGVRVITGAEVQEIGSTNHDVLWVRTVSGFTIDADMVLVAAGAHPAVELAQTAGIHLGVGGAVKVERTMATNVADIWAAGDGVQTWHRILNRHVYMPLGTTAHKQGRVAGENMLGRQREFQGSLGTQVVKVFNLVAARTGLREQDAAAAGFHPFTVSFTTWDHKVYYPGAKELHLMVTGDRKSGRLLGAQIVGSYKTEVSKRIDILATALFHGMRIEDLSDLDLAYTPPLSSPWDPVQMAAMKWCAEIGTNSKLN